MSNCPLFAAVENAQRNNCRECRLWNQEKQKCSDEEKLKKLGELHDETTKNRSNKA